MNISEVAPSVATRPNGTDFVRVQLVLFALFCLLTLFGAGPAWGDVEAGRGPVSVVVDGATLPSLIGHLEGFTDETAVLTAEDVLFGPAASRFAPILGKFSGGYSSAAHWFRFTLTLSPQQPSAPLLLNIWPPFLDDVRVFVPRTQTPQTLDDFTISHLGDEQPFTQRPVLSSELLVPIIPIPGASSTIYIRLVTSSTALMQPSLLSYQRAIAVASKRDILFGAVYGTSVLITVINLLFWIWLQERVYLLYSVYALTATVLFSATHGTILYLLSDSYHKYSYYFQGLSACANMASGILFAATLLRIRHFSTWMSWFTMVVIGMTFLGMAATAIRQWTVIAGPIFLLVMLQVAIFLYASVRLSLRGDTGARLYLVSFVPLIIIVVGIALRNIGIVGGLPFGDYSMEIAVLTHLVMMTIGLASRIRRSEAERLQAQEQALDVSRNAEKAANMLVFERTQELVEAKAKLERTLAKEQQFSRQQVQFVDMISHEFRTPLAILQDAHASLSNRISTTTPSALTDLKRMSQAFARLNEVLEVGLQRERMDTSSLKAKFINCDVRTLVREAVATAISAHPGRQIHTDGIEDWSGYAVLGDFALLKTALVNLLDNAAKYSPADRPIEVTLETHAATADWAETLSIAVTDHGDGISEVQRQRVFEKYYRSPSSVNQPGAGLGLHLVQRIMEMHDGTASLSTHVGSGTTVSLTMWRQPTHDNQDGPPVATETK